MTTPSRGELNPLLKRRWKILRTDVVRRFIADEGVWIVADEAGVGKTTNISEGLLEHSERVLFACQRHEKALDLPEDYFHTFGASARKDQLCILQGCSHEDTDECPRACHLYPNPPDEFSKFEAIYGHRQAHLRVDNVENDCFYLENREERKEHDFVVGMHQHLTHPDLRDGLVVIDETPGMGVYTTEWDAAELERAEDVLRSMLENWLADWVDTLRQDIVKDSDFLNDGEDDVTLRVDPPDREVTAEELARIKIEFNQWVIHGPGEADPCFDAILGALAEVGFYPKACRAAIDGPNHLEHCPLCRKYTVGDSPVCSECHWEYTRFDILDYRRKSHSRVTAYASTDRLAFVKIPAVDDLPNHVMILDATPRPKLVASLFGVDESDIIVDEGPEFDPNVRMKVIGNGQYHASTIAATKSLQKRIQRGIDRVDRQYEHVLFVLKSSLKNIFDIPQEGNIVRKWGRLRGMNLHDNWKDSDDIAVCLIGAPNPDMRKVAHIARALGEKEADHKDVKKPPEVEVNTYGTPLLEEMFKSVHEDELIQAIHRVRPIHQNVPVPVYKFTNVPIGLPIDEHLSWMDFLSGGLTDRAIREMVVPLCDSFDGNQAETSRSEIYKIVEAKGPRDKRRVRDWVDKLVDSKICERNGYASDSSHRVLINMEELRKFV